MILADTPLAGTTDTVVKKLQIDAFIRGHAALMYPARGLDPAVSLYPLDGLHYVLHGQPYSLYPPYFFWFSGVWFRLGGNNALLALVAICGIGCVGLTAMLARRYMDLRRAAYCVLCVGLATPLLYYSTAYWEHTFALALFLGAVCLVLSKTLRATAYLGAGLLLGMASVIRPELYIWAIVLLLSKCYFVKERTTRMYVVLAFVGIAVISTMHLWFQYSVLQGVPVHIARNIDKVNQGDFVQTRVKSLLVFLFGNKDSYPSPWGITTAVSAWGPMTLMLTAIAWIVGWSRTGQQRYAIAFYACAVIAVVWNGATGLVFGVLAGFPFFLLALAQEVKRQKESSLNVLGTTALIGTVLVIGAGHMSGPDWGPRFLLPLYPLGCIWLFAVSDRVFDERYHVWGACALVMIGLLVQLEGALGKVYVVYKMRPAIQHLRSYEARRVVFLEHSTDALRYLVLNDLSLFSQFRFMKAHNYVQDVGIETVLTEKDPGSEIDEFTYVTYHGETPPIVGGFSVRRATHFAKLDFHDFYKRKP